MGRCAACAVERCCDSVRCGCPSVMSALLQRGAMARVASCRRHLAPGLSGCSLAALCTAWYMPRAAAQLRTPVNPRLAKGPIPDSRSDFASKASRMPTTGRKEPGGSQAAARAKRPTERNLARLTRIASFGVGRCCTPWSSGPCSSVERAWWDRARALASVCARARMRSRNATCS